MTAEALLYRMYQGWDFSHSGLRAGVDYLVGKLLHIYCLLTEPLVLVAQLPERDLDRLAVEISEIHHIILHADEARSNTVFSRTAGPFTYR